MQQLPEPYSLLVNALTAPTPLTGDTGTDDATHKWCEAEVKAAVQAWASERPLLVRGEAGAGKSQLARALAQVLHAPFISEVIHPRYEATDLLYKDDPVKRLATAQVLAVACPADQGDRMAWLEERLAAKNFVTPGPLLLAFQKDKPASSHANMPRAVVLIDEIDKADSDLPNALLGVLGDRSITVHPTGEVVASPRRHRPLIVITTNEDRELPAAFVRRCAVLNLRPDDTSEPAFVQWLFERASVHAQLASLASSSVFTRAGKQVWADRKAAEQNGLPTVGLAEYLDLLYSLCRVSGGDAARAELLLDQLAPFALVKHRDQNQSRAPVPLDPQA